MGYVYMILLIYNKNKPFDISITKIICLNRNYNTFLTTAFLFLFNLSNYYVPI